MLLGRKKSINCSIVASRHCEFSFISIIVCHSKELRNQIINAIA
jgi:hypothetical protein